MRFVRTTSMLALALALAAVPAHAQRADGQPLPAPDVTVGQDARALHSPPTAGAAQAQALPASDAVSDRAAVRRVLRQDEVREIAGRMGVDLDEATERVAMLQGSALERLSTRARQINHMLAAQETITLTATTLIIILLGIIIIVLLAS